MSIRVTPVGPAVGAPRSGGPEFVVSEHEVWVDGIYATEAAARRAPAVGPSELAALWKRVRPRAITEADLDGVSRCTSTSTDPCDNPIRCRRPNGHDSWHRHGDLYWDEHGTSYTWGEETSEGPFAPEMPNDEITASCAPAPRS